MHPYRDPLPPQPKRALDVESCIVHGTLWLVGAIGVAVGLAFARPGELAVGGLFLAAAFSIEP